jgi:hypothetical protein
MNESKGNDFLCEEQMYLEEEEEEADKESRMSCLSELK